MTARRYILQSLLHYRFAYLGVLAGAVLGATVLLGALFAGDSVSASLQQIGQNRIGRTTHLIAAGDRFFRQELANEFAAAAKVRAAPVMFARGTATQATTQAAANQVQLVGVTDAFWQFAPTPVTVPLDAATSTVAVNETLAQRLKLVVGDTVIVRLHKPGILAGNAPVAGAESKLQNLRCKVGTIVGDASFGRFTLDTTQIAQPSIFLPIKLLQESLSRPGRANLILIDDVSAVGPALAAVPSRSAGDSRDGMPASGSPTPAPANPSAHLERALASSMRLADYGLSLHWRDKAAVFEVTSDRVFLDPELANPIVAAIPSAQPVVSYLVNELRKGGRAAPYSIATATSAAAAPFLPADMAARDIVLNDWLAEDLQAAAGDDVRLTYFQLNPAGALIEQQTTFRVRAIVPLRGLAADAAWMPEFPGISDTQNQSEWDPGLPLDLERIREKDERYWDDHRGAPKAFLSLAGGRDIWSTRWGRDTALRIPLARERESDLTAILLGALRPEMNQLLLRNLRDSAQQGAKSAVDFGGLFIGMSFFLIVAALGLVAMLFQFVLLQRNREDALLGAVGLAARQVLRWRLAEGFVLLLVGCLIGLPLAALYTRGILRFLESIWAGQGAGSTFRFAATPASVAMGVVVFLLISLFAIWLAIRKQTRRTLSIRLAAQAQEIVPAGRGRKSSLIIAVAATMISVIALALSGRGLPAQAAFYLAGFSLLVAGLAACRRSLSRIRSVAGAARDPVFDAAELGRLNLNARRARSLTVVGLIAIAVFMVLSVASFRKQVGADWLERASGTGGFAFLVETTAAQNPARDGKTKGFEIFERDVAELGEIIPLRSGVGDNANCFNLNTTAQPRLLAVDSGRLAARGAFKPKIAGAPEGASGWNALGTSAAAGAIPALVDETTLMWALKRKVGDVIAYTDENGRSFDVRIAGTIADSIFQGYLLVDEPRFLHKFPSNPGYSVFLVDAKIPADLPGLRNRLEAAARDAGGRVEITRDVLTAFHQIENTYIAIFNVLGALGVILGSLGLAIVVARNLRERRGEFAVMSAIGLPRSVLGRMVFAEFGRLVAWGIVIGAIASAVAVWPGLRTLPPAPTVLLVGSLLAGIVALNLGSGWLVFRWSLRDLRASLGQ